MDVDPLASMRCWAITTRIGGREFEIPALPAVDWWPVLVSADHTEILDILESSSSVLVDTMLLAGDITLKDLGETLTEVIEEVTGRSAYAATALAIAASTRWDIIGGQIARTGFRWETQPIGAALDLIYLTILEGLEKEPREKFLAMLDNAGKPSERRNEKVAAEFEAMAGPRPAPTSVPGKSSAAPSGGARPRTRTRPRPPRQDDQSGATKPQP